MQLIATIRVDIKSGEQDWHWSAASGDGEWEQRGFAISYDDASAKAGEHINKILTFVQKIIQENA